MKALLKWAAAFLPAGLAGTVLLTLIDGVGGDEGVVLAVVYGLALGIVSALAAMKKAWY